MFDIKEKGIYNIGTGKAVSFKQVADLIAKKYNAKIKYIFMSENLKHLIQSYTCANLEKLNTVLKSQVLNYRGIFKMSTSLFIVDNFLPNP